ncbi:MAG: alpha-pore-forming tripartite toxin MakABE regulator [Solirubrobacterales bacterium]
MSEQQEAGLNIVDVLIVVDVVGALASGNLTQNVYLVDTNKYVGSGSEGQAELKTVIKDGQILRWSVVPVSPSTDVEITGFTGQMVNDKVCVPRKVETVEGSFWEGRVESQGQAKTEQYSTKLTMDGKQMEFDPYLEIKVS